MVAMANTYGESMTDREMLRCAKRLCRLINADHDVHESVIELLDDMASLGITFIESPENQASRVFLAQFGVRA